MLEIVLAIHKVKHDVQRLPGWTVGELRKVLKEEQSKG